MSTERLDLLCAWQEAALIERKALVAVRDELSDRFSEYPRVATLDYQIRAIDRDISERSLRIDELQRRVTPQAGSSRLSLLLRRQNEAREDREELASAREALWAEAKAKGYADLDDEQDRKYLALTREIAGVDEEISVRAEEIETLAALAAVTV